LNRTGGFRQILCLLLLAGLPLEAETVLSSYACTRPSPPDEGTAHNVELACGLVNGKSVGPGQVFSYYQCLTPGAGMWQMGRTIRDGKYILSFGGGYCQVCTAIYNAVLLAGLLVVERYPHSFYDDLEAYAPAGFDAAVSRETRANFQFVNTRREAVTLRVSREGPKVTVSVLGQGKPKNRWVSAQVLEKKPKTVRIEAMPGLGPGERRVRKRGMDGLKVRRFLHELDARGNTRTFNLGVDHYNMIPEIVETGPGAPVGTP
jgi:vancomycin resistance protein YoaR